jgi:hypothetical protein
MGLGYTCFVQRVVTYRCEEQGKLDREGSTTRQVSVVVGDSWFSKHPSHFPLCAVCRSTSVPNARVARKICQRRSGMKASLIFSRI